ncbi:MAG: hypothetical protein EAZ95_00105 [Bacteroidetes bacterium]|nr:MAG: hypothetical protein EAZ95_00105 [Bacteroidota bacterium]
MKNARIFIALLPLLFLLTACPYSADFPLDKPTQKVDSGLLGKWVEQSDSPNENPNFFAITKVDANTYQFEKNDYNSNDKNYTKEILTGYFTPVGKVMFLNLKKQDDDKFYFYKVELTDKQNFVMHEVTDNIDEKFATANELKAFFDKHKDLSFFYNKDEKKYKKQ